MLPVELFALYMKGGGVTDYTTYGLYMFVGGGYWF